MCMQVQLYTTLPCRQTPLAFCNNLQAVDEHAAPAGEDAAEAAAVHSLDKENTDGMGLLSLDDTPLGAPDGRVAALGAQDGSSASLDAALRAQVRCLTARHRLRICRVAAPRVIHRDWPWKIYQHISLWCSTFPCHLRDQRGW